jgi:hypothetical protein
VSRDDLNVGAATTTAVHVYGIELLECCFSCCCVLVEPEQSVGSKGDAVVVTAVFSVA